MFGPYVFTKCNIKLYKLQRYKLVIGNPLFDTIQINLAKGTAYYEEYDGTLKPISSGWIQIKPSDIELKETNNLL